MFVHIVVWRVKPETSVEDRLKCKTLLEGLNDRIAGVVKIEVGVDTLHGPNSGDISLYSVFESRAAYETYLTHPDHEAVKPHFAGLVSERRIVDYDI